MQKKLISEIIPFALLCLGCIEVKAQENMYGKTGGIPERVIIVNGDSTKLDKDVEIVMYDTKDLHFQDPSTPRFLFIDSRGKTALGIGGYIEGIVQYDFNGSIDSNGFTTFEIPVPRDNAMLNRFNADATHSTIFLRLLTNTRLGVLQGYVQTNFSGNNGNYGVVLKQAYVSLCGFTAGLSNSTFNDPSSGVPTIDYQGPSGAIGVKNLIFQYKHKFNSHWSAAVSIEGNKGTYTNSDENKMISQRCPDIPVYIQYAWGNGKDHIRLSGIYRNLSYRNLILEKNKSVNGFGVMLSGVATPVDLITLYYQGAYGKGIGRYVNDLGGNGYDLVSTENGAMVAPEDLGITGGVQFNITKNFFISGSYSLNRVYGSGCMGATSYHRADYYVANAFYSFLDGFQVGAEYLHGSRYDYNGNNNSANRVEVMLKYSF